MVVDQPIVSLYNGKRQESIPLTNRGFRYGDGVFETLVIHHQQIELWSHHFQRLMLGCKALKIEFTLTEDQLLDEIMSICTDNEWYIVRLVVSRSGRGRSYRVLEGAGADRLISLYQWPNSTQSPSQGLRLQTCSYQLPESPRLAKIKHLNRLDQVLATLEIDYNYFDEALLTDFSASVISGTMSNLFFVSNDSLITPLIKTVGIEGTMRSFVLDSANKIGIKSAIKTVTIDELMKANEIFMTNSLWAIKPVQQINEQEFECPGKLTTLLLKQINQQLGRL